MLNIKDDNGKLWVEVIIVAFLWIGDRRCHRSKQQSRLFCRNSNRTFCMTESIVVSFRENKQSGSRFLATANFIVWLPPEVPRDICF